MHFLHILESFRLDMSQSSLSVYSRRHLQHDSMPFFPLALCFTTFLLGHSFLDEKVTYIFRLSVFLIFLAFFSFCYFLLTFYWACFPFKKFPESIIKMGIFCHRVAMCSGRKFCFEFFTPISEHFHASFRLH